MLAVERLAFDHAVFTNSAECAPRMMVHYFQRKRRPNANYSLEFIFDDVRSRLANQVQSKVVIAPFYSNGLIRRGLIALSAWWNQGEVTHVTGDINFAAILLSRQRSILTILDCGFLERSGGIRRTLLKHFWLTQPVRAATVVTTISAAARDDILRHTGCDPDKVVVIPVAVSEQFQRSNRTPQFDLPRILLVGTAPNKNIPRILQALQGVRCKVVILGKLQPSIMEAIQSTKCDVENHVGLTVDAVREQYELADLVVFASVFEGFGMPIIEAQKIGRPVVTSNCSSMPEVAGDAACFVDPLDVLSIRAGITKVLSDPDYRRQLIERGFENAKRFDADRIAQQYYDVYRSLLEIRPSSSRLN